MEFLGIEQYLLEFLTIWYTYQDITQTKPKKSHFLLAFLLSLSFAIMIPVNAFLPLWLSLFIISLLEEQKRTLCRRLFYTGLSVVVVDLFLRSYYLFISPVILTGIDVAPDAIPWLRLLAFPFIIPTNRAIRRLFRIHYPTLLQVPDKSIQNYIYKMNGLFLLYYMVHYVVFFKEPSIMSIYDRVALFASIMALGYMLTILNRKAQDRHLADVKMEQELYLANLEYYSQHLEGLYQNIHSFKHDYDNILISLNDSIYHGDIHDIETVYSDVLQKSRDRMENEDYLFYQLIPMRDKHIKLLITRDLLEAKRLGVNVSASLPDTDEIPAIPQKDFIVLLHSMLQLATQEAKMSPYPSLRLRIEQGMDGFEVSVIYGTTVAKVSSSCLATEKTSQSVEGEFLHIEAVQDILRTHSNIDMSFDSGCYKARETLLIKTL